MLVETGKNSYYIEVFLIVCAIQNDISVRALESSKEKILSHLTYANTMDVEALYMKFQFTNTITRDLLIVMTSWSSIAYILFLNPLLFFAF